MTHTQTQATRRGPSAILAAILSFFIPGLGQIYAGRVLRGVIIAIPQVVLIGLLFVLYLQGSARLVGLLFQYALVVAAVNIVMLVYRALAVIDAYRVARAREPARSLGERRSPGWAAAGVVVLALLLAATAGLHGVSAVVSFAAHEAQGSSFGECDEVDAELPVRGCETGQTRPSPVPSASPTIAPTASDGPTAPGATPATPAPSTTDTPAPGTTVAPSATVTPSVTAPPVIVSDAYWAQNGRLDLLLLGVDAIPGVRPGLRPDAQHVVSVDLATGRSAIVSLPRYTQYPPLPAHLEHLWACGCFKGYDGYLNHIYTYATDHPDDFPGGNSRGFRATEEVIETLLGIDIDGILVVDLQGFVEAIDAIGGIIIDVPTAVYDADYGDEFGREEIVDIKAGWQQMDGHTALQYVRSRHQDGDIQRLGRQQVFLRALRRQMTTCVVQILPRVPELLGALGRAIRTDVPVGEVPALLDLLTRTGKPRRIELHTENGFARDLTEPGQHERWLAAMASAFEPQAGEDPDEPDPAPPDRLGSGC